jgi:ribosomal protein S18 acetylase RimI-like enzyme
MGTGHIAQVAVDPGMQGRGVGARLVTGAMAAFAAGGFSRVTLLVSEENHRAVGLYTGLGFRNRASFVVALNRQPRRLSRVAPAVGGANWQDAVALRLHGV